MIVAFLRILGTPSDDSWCGVEALPFHQPIFPAFRAQSLASLLPTLDLHGLDLISVGFPLSQHVPKILLQKFLQVDPQQRISADDALKHIFFDELKRPIETSDPPEQS